MVFIIRMVHPAGKREYCRYNGRELSSARDAGIGTYILFKKPITRGITRPCTPQALKSKYSYHTEAMDRAMEGGIDDVGIGVLFGLNTYRYDFVGLLMHAEHLEAAFGVGPHTISVPPYLPSG